MANADDALRVVILAGGVGSRFWPASTPARPKQLLPLATTRPLIVDSVERARSLVPADRLHILTREELRPAIERLLPDLPASAFWIEPTARGTGPVLAWAAHRIAAEDPDAVMVSLHADHAIPDTAALTATLRRAARLARSEDLLVTLAIHPTRPETGYGWIEAGAALGSEDGIQAWRVRAFEEKPDLETARRYLERGHFWNSGIFVWKASTFLAEVRRCSPEIGPHLSLLTFSDSPGSFFGAVAAIAVDEAVLERSERVATVEAAFSWDDVGSWTSLDRSHAADADGNVAVGPHVSVDAGRNLIWTEEGPVVLWDVKDLLVVRAGGVTVVAPRDRGPEWKALLDRLPASVRDLGKPEVPENTSGEDR